MEEVPSPNLKWPNAFSAPQMKNANTNLYHNVQLKRSYNKLLKRGRNLKTKGKKLRTENQNAISDFKCSKRVEDNRRKP